MINRRFLSGVLCLALVCGLVALLHFPMARPLLVRLGVPCPVDSVLPADVAAMRTPALRKLQGSVRAPATAMLEMHDSREADVRAWTASRGLLCRDLVRGLHYLTCTDVPAETAGGEAHWPPIQDLTFSFDESGALVGVDALRRGLSADEAASVASWISSRLSTTLGDPAGSAGQFGAEYLAADAFRTAFISYRFADYLVSLTAVNIPGSGVVVRERHLGARAE